MPSAPTYRLVFAPQVLEHISAIDRKYHRLIRSVLHERLAVEPDVVRRNRKPLEAPAPFDATWELRFGPRNCFRTFYEVDAESRSVRILAVGVKDRDRLRFGAKDYIP
jgi:hypothetical protein